MKNPLYILILFLLPLCSFAEETLEQKVRNILNDKSITDTYVRWKTAYDTTAPYYPHLSFEEAKLVFSDILLPFIDKEVKDAGKNNQAKADIYRRISLVYQYRGEEEDMATAETFLKKGVKHAEQSKNDTLTAFFYEQYAHLQSLTGSIQVSHDYIYKAIKLYESIGKYDKVSQCLYRIAINLLQTNDIAGLRRVIEQMKQNIEKQSSVGALYYLYSVQSVYYGMLNDDHPENPTFQDSALWASRNLIHLIENYREELPGVAAVAYNYMNMALLYEKCYPTNYDSIYYFLDKTLESKPPRQKDINAVIDIKVYTLYAQLHFKQDRYKEAEKDMLYVLSLLEQVNDYNTAVIEFSEAYKFLAKYYETVNRPAEALKYHKLLLENEAKRYDSDKIAAMDDMLVKYETEKKEVQIETLTKEKQAAQRILLLTISLIAVLLIALLIFIRFYQLRRKNLQQSIYESALLAELKQNELEENLKEKKYLQQQCEKLEIEANLNKEKAESYNVALLQYKQQLEQKTTQIMIGKISDRISKSVLKKTKKDTYLQQLSELDIDTLEQSFLSAHEKISSMDMKYIICFIINMEVQDISLLFNIDTSSVYTVRYRIKKKFPKENLFKFYI